MAWGGGQQAPAAGGAAHVRPPAPIVGPQPPALRQPSASVAGVHWLCVAFFAAGVACSDHRLTFAVGNAALAVILPDSGLRTAAGTFRTGPKPPLALATAGVADAPPLFDVAFVVDGGTPLAESCGCDALPAPAGRVGLVGLRPIAG
jgi:hypothetical protein